MTTDEQRAEELLANDDIPVDVSRPVYVGIVNASLEKTELKADDADQSVTIVLSWLTNGDVSDTNGRNHPPGTRIQDRLNVKPKASMDSGKQKQVREIAIKTASDLARAAGKPFTKAVTASEAYAALKTCVGLKQLLRMEEKNGYTQVRYARPQ